MQILRDMVKWRMNIFLKIILILMACNSASANTNRPHRILTCALGKEHQQSVEVFAGQRIYDTYIIYIKNNTKKTLQPIFPGDINDSRGSLLLVHCAGHHEKILIIQGEFFGSGYPKGIVLRNNGGKYERIDFAERAFPEWIYLSQQEMKVFIPNTPTHQRKKFTIYHFQSTTGQTNNIEYVDELPSAAHYDAIHIQFSRYTTHKNKL